MKTIKVSEAQDRVLDWLVAKCEGLNPNTAYGKPVEYGLFPGWREGDGFGYPIKAYGLNWGYGGPIIDRESIGWFDARKEKGYCQAAKPGAEFVQRGPTPLIAAMRCYVTSKLGEEAEVPEELL